MLRILLVMSLSLGSSCSKKKAEEQPSSGQVDPAAPETQSADEKANAAEPAPGADKSERRALRRLDEPAEEERYESPTERRLLSDRVESSTFLWTDWNRFQENYHPNYALDGDPKTAWVEGADESGAGEWIRVHTSKVSGSTKLRLRLLAGYHKSKSLYEKNARPKTIAVKTLPGGPTKEFALTDTMDWQEVELQLPNIAVEAVEISVRDVYEGSKYLDLCISDLEIFVTGLTKDSPAFEKRKLERLLGWKKERLEAAKLFADSDKANALPIAPGYRVVPNHGKREVPEVEEGAGSWLRRAVAVATAETPQHAKLLALASKSIQSEYSDWVQVKVVSKRALPLPEADGLRQPDGFELIMGSPSDAFFLPHTGEFSLIDSSRLSAFDVKVADRADDCRPDKSTFKRPPSEQLSGPTPRALLHQWCVEEETREGTVNYLSEMLLLYDSEGRILFLVGPGDVQYYDWKAGEGGQQIVGGLRFFDSGEIERLAVKSEVARP